MVVNAVLAMGGAGIPSAIKIRKGEEGSTRCEDKEGERERGEGMNILPVKDAQGLGCSG